MPIDEVLRLLTRSHQHGSVDITGNGLRGRVFIGESGINLATTADDNDLHRHLLNSGYADDRALDRVASGETTLAAVAEDNAALIELIREMTVESLYHIGDRGREFQVREGVTTPYASPKSFDLETLLEETERRKNEWDRVAEVVPDLTGAMSFSRDLGDRQEVTVDANDWKLLSEIGAGASVREIADSLGTTEFWTARIAARLVENDLVVLGLGSAPSPEGEVDYAPEPIGDPVGVSDEQDAVTISQEAVEEDGALSSEDAVTAEVGDTDHDESWWQEPEDQDDPVDWDDASRAPEVVSEGLSEMPGVESADDDSDVEEDTETFLSKVFSELENSEPEAEEGHGLLRRRRMGTLRDFSSDS